MLSSIGRAAIRRSGARAAGAGVGATGTSTTRVVRRNLNLSNTNLPHRFAPQFAKSFATATITTKVKTTKNATAKSTKKAPVKKPAKKVAKKPLKKKAVKKPLKKKAVPKKPKAKKVPSEEEKKKRDIKATKALILSPPKQKPASAWMIVVNEAMTANTNKDLTPPERMQIASSKYKSLDTAELEAYNHQANENKLHNKKIYASWLESLTPEQVRISNAARQNLIHKKTPKSGSLIADSRLPKRPLYPYIAFLKDKWASGDFKNIPVVDAGKQISVEWKGLSEAEKKPYLDRYEEDSQRYKMEFKTVFGHDSTSNTRVFKKAKAEVKN